MKISQREARRLRKRVAELEGVLKAQRASWTSTYPGGVHIETVDFSSAENPALIAVSTARRLDHAVVCVNDGKSLRLHALPHYKAGL